MANLKAGVIGLGIMGRNHARVLASLDGVRLVGIVDPGISRSDVSNFAPIFNEIEDLLSQGIDYCLVAVPTALHEKVGLALSNAGVHALIEKPLANNLKAAKSLVKSFSKNGLIGAVGHIERYNPALQEARKRILNGELGQIYQILTRRQGPFPARIQDVGVIKDLATHDIDLTAWISNKSYTEVSARTASRAERVHEDLVNIVAELEEKIIASHNVNWLSPFKERTTVILGERGAFVIDMLNADLTFHVNGKITTQWSDIAKFRGVSEGDVIKYAIAKPEPLRTEHENFRDAVLGKNVEIVSLQQGLNTVKVAEAVLESATTGSTIRII